MLKKLSIFCPYYIVFFLCFIGNSQEYKPLEFSINEVEGLERIKDFELGVNTCIGLMEKILERNVANGTNIHTIFYSVKDLNEDSEPGTHVGGVASTPDPSRYGTYDLNLTLDIKQETQFTVFQVFFHEAGHTLASNHVGEGVMVSGSIPRYAFIDKPVLEAFGKIGYRFIDPIQQRLLNNEKVYLDELLKTYMNTSQEALAAIIPGEVGSPDTIAPSKPEDLVSSMITQTTVDLSWSAATDNNGVSGYTVYLNGEEIADSRATKISINNLIPETAYEVYITAYDQAGNVSDFSNTITIKTGTNENIEGEFSEELLTLLELVNQARAENGRNPLKMNKKLVAAAEFHANDMNTNNFFSHTGSNGSRSSQRVSDQGYEWNSVGENIASGQRTANQVHESWMNSEGHRKNILSPNYTEIGLARVANLWVQVFARSSSSSLSNEQIASDAAAVQSLYIYPNSLSRGQNEITIAGVQNKNSIGYEIYDITGRKISQGKVANKIIKVEGLSMGMHFIRLKVDNNAVTKRFLVK